MKIKNSYIYSVVILAFCFNFTLLSQNDIDYGNLVNSEYGNEFYLTALPNLHSDNNFGTKEVRLIFNSYFDTEIIIQIKSTGYLDTIKLTAFESQEYIIDAKYVEPYRKYVEEKEVNNFVFENSSLYLQSEHLFSVSLISNFNSTSDGFKGIPKYALGNEYIISSYTDSRNSYDDYKSIPSMTAIIATEDQTEIDILFGGNSLFNSSNSPNRRYTTKSKTLNKGDIWLFSSLDNGDDLSGSKITSNKPISIISGNQCANIPTHNQLCDYITDMELPIEYWGTEYIVPKLHSRRYEPIVRVFAKEEETKIFRDGQLVTVLTKSGGVSGEAFIEIPRNTNAPKSYKLSADKPIKVVLYNTGTAEDNDNIVQGGPFMMTLSPLENMVNFTQVFTPINENAGFNNFINIVYHLDSNSETPKDLLIGIKDKENIIWKPIADFDISYNEKVSTNLAIVELNVNPGKEYFIKSTSKFNVYSYGFSTIKSYGFASSYKFEATTLLDNEPPKTTWIENCGQFNGKTTDETKLYRNIINKKDNFEYKQTYVNEDNTEILWELNVKNKAINAIAELITIDQSRNTIISKIEYNAPNLIIEPKIINFKSINLNGNSSKKIKITNNSKSDYELNTLEVKKYNNLFNISINGKIIEDKYIIPPNSEIIFEINFFGNEYGKFEDKIIIGDSCFSSELVTVSGIVEYPKIEVSDIDFGRISLGENLSKSFSLKNNSGVELKVYGYNEVYNKAVYKHNINPIFFKDTLHLKPYHTKVYEVICTPIKPEIVLDSIIFYSNSIAGDSIAKLQVHGIKSGLISSDYNWGSKLINRQKFPSGPYSIKNNNNGIVIKNKGIDTIKVIDIIDDKKSNSPFNFEIDKVLNIDIAPDSIIKYQAYFNPQEVGNYKNSLTYSINKGKTFITYSKFMGRGVAPKIKIDKDILSFGTSILNFENNTKRKKFTITNENWEFAHPLSFYSLKFDTSELQENGFKIISTHKDTLLNIGQILEFEIEFSAEFEGKHSAVIEINSNALENKIIKLEGMGRSNPIKVSLDQNDLRVCPGEHDSTTINIENFSNDAINFEAIELIDKTGKGEDYIVNIDVSYLSNVFTVDANSILIIPIEYSPIEFGENQYEIVVKQMNNIDPYTFDLNLLTLEYESNIELTPLSQNANVNQVVKSGITLKGEDLELLNDVDLFVSFKYDKKAFAYVDNSLKIKEDLKNNYIISTPNINSNDGIVSFSMNYLDINDFKFKDIEELAEFEFLTLFTSDSTYNPNIEIDISTEDSKCFTFSSDTIGQIIINEVCAEDKRKLTLSTFDIYLEKITPNPINNNTNINYSLSFDAFIDLSLYNSNGELVKVLKSSFISAGQHSYNLDISNLNSGVYYYRLISNGYSKMHPLIIKK